MKLFLTFWIAIILCTLQIYADTIFVRVNGADNNDGSSWAQAFATIQKALEEAQSGDEIWVAAGNYNPTEDINGNSSPDDPQTKTLQLKENVKLFGGFPADNDAADMTDRDWETYETIISGSLGDDNFCYNIFYLPSELGLTRLAIIDGFTISDGMALGDEGEFFNQTSGAAIFMEDNSPTIRNCYFIDNMAYDYGGAIFIIGNSNPLIESCIFEMNFSDSGGAISIEEAAADILNCEFKFNIAFDSGAIDIYESTVNIYESMFTDNYSIFGGGVSIYGSTVLIEKCEFTGNGIFNEEFEELFDGELFGEYPPNYSFYAGAFAGIYSEIELIESTFEQNAAYIGGAVLLAATEIDIDDCTFNSNNAVFSGAAIVNTNIDTSEEFEEFNVQCNINNSFFTNNTINFDIDLDSGDFGLGFEFFFLFFNGGAAILNFVADMNITNSVFDNNKFEIINLAEFEEFEEGFDEFLLFLSSGGAINHSFGNLTLINNLITNNSALFGGGISNFGFFKLLFLLGEGEISFPFGEFFGDFSNTNIEIINSTIADNNAMYAGGLFLLGEDTTVDIYNSIIWDNETEILEEFEELDLFGEAAGNQFVLGLDAVVNLYYSCYRNEENDVVILEDFVEEDNAEFNVDENSITDNPEFADAENGDYTLQETSPCINAGNNSFVPSKIKTDLAGEDRILEFIVDMGCYELSVPLIITLGGPYQVCYNSSVPFLADELDIENGSGDYTFSWKPSYLIAHPDDSEADATLTRALRTLTYNLHAFDNGNGRKGVGQVEVIVSPRIKLNSKIVHRFKAENLAEPINLYDLIFGEVENLEEHLNELVYGEEEAPENVQYCFAWVDRFTGEIFENAYSYVPQPNSRLYLWLYVYIDEIGPPLPPGHNCDGCELTKRRLNVIVRGNEIDIEID